MRRGGWMGGGEGGVRTFHVMVSESASLRFEKGTKDLFPCGINASARQQRRDDDTTACTEPEVCQRGEKTRGKRERQRLSTSATNE